MIAGIVSLQTQTMHNAMLKIGLTLRRSHLKLFGETLKLDIGPLHISIRPRSVIRQISLRHPISIMSLDGISGRDDGTDFKMNRGDVHWHRNESRDLSYSSPKPLI